MILRRYVQSTDKEEGKEGRRRRADHPLGLSLPSSSPLFPRWCRLQARKIAEGFIVDEDDSEAEARKKRKGKKKKRRRGQSDLARPSPSPGSATSVCGTGSTSRPCKEISTLSDAPATEHDGRLYLPLVSST